MSEYYSKLERAGSDLHQAANSLIKNPQSANCWLNLQNAAIRWSAVSQSAFNDAIVANRHKGHYTKANPQPCGCPFCGAERKLNRMNPRLDELLERLVAVGNPHSKFSASEFHELYDGVQEIEDERVKIHACLSRLSADYKSIGSIMEEVESLIMYENRKRMD